MLSMLADIVMYLWALEPVLVDGNRHGFHNQQEGVVMSHNHAIGIEQVTCQHMGFLGLWTVGQQPACY